jgi:glycosyltransferase involved in cell wall biosynthesis
MNTPKISIIIPTLNNSKILPEFFKHLNKQVYPKRNIELIVVDGGSKDKTIALARKNRARILQNPGVYADIGVSIGMRNASGEILMILAVDNFLKNKYSIRTMANVFEDKRVFAAFPKHASDSSDNFLTRYINTFTDPFNHFVYGYASNGRTFQKVYKTIEHNKIYDIYDFNFSKEKPLIAFAQGFSIRRGFLKKKEDEFDDLKPVIRLIKQKKNIAFVHSIKLYHHTLKNFSHLVKKQKWATKNFLEKKDYGIYSRKNFLSLSQQYRIKIWPIYVASIVGPIVFSLYHLLKDREFMWFFHPAMCYISLYSSIVAFIEFELNKTR